MSWPQRKEAAPARADMRKLDEALTSIIGALLQQSDKKARAIIGVATAKVVAAGIAAGVLGTIGSVGVASTGTAIATLSGAVATTATLYWIGSTIGLGVAAGSVMLSGGAFAVAVPAAIMARRRVFGRPRTEDQLSEQEQATLYASLRLASGLRLATAGQECPTQAEMQIVSEQALRPLIRDIYALIGEETIERETDQTCASQKAYLALLPRRRLRRVGSKLDLLARKFEGT